MRRDLLFELLRLNPKRVADPVEYWALFAHKYYEKLFKKIDDPREVTKTYLRIAEDERLHPKEREALKFFYNLRMDELENPDFWDRVAGRIKEENVMKKKKLVKESLFEDSREDNLELALHMAKEISKREHCVQHVNEVRPGHYEVSDWYDADATVASFEDGREI